jgi:SagB-type dehydrogenase family enzyme
MTDAIGPEFMRKTRYDALEASEQALGRPQPSLQVPAGEGAERIALPKVDRIDLGRADLLEVINRRRSVREYADAPLGLDELSCLRWCTQGVKEVLGDQATLRTVPSAGARHAFETYLLANRVDALAAGLYRFLAVGHELVRLPAPPDVGQRLCEAALGQAFVLGGAVTFVWAADARRMTWRYGQRGYRYLLIDVGHVCQNLYLAAEVLGCGACAIAAFDDAKVDAVCGLDGRRQFAVYLTAVGRKP